MAGSVVGNLNDPDYLNWLKSNRALHCTIDVLRNVCSAEMQRFHLLLVGKHTATVCKKPCTHTDIITHGRVGWSIRCPNNVCSKWLIEIVRERYHKSTTLKWQNSDFRQWQTQPWQIAKVYMERQDPAWINPTDTDAAGVLQLLMNCRLFKNKMDWKKVDAVSSCSIYSYCNIGIFCEMHQHTVSGRLSLFQNYVLYR